VLDKIFCYGTLQSPEILRAVIGREITPHKALLEEYASFRIVGENYPGLVPAPGHKTDGVVYQGLTRREMMLLDRYEGLFYKREIVEVMNNDGAVSRAWSYVLKTAYRHCVTGESWSFDEFESENFSSYPGKI
jgi:gamma-glutamylcyclotransferase (GGCT)/AIG2-like uncharacterized protein YtfP